MWIRCLGSLCLQFDVQSLNLAAIYNIDEIPDISVLALIVGLKGAGLSTDHKHVWVH